MAKEEKKVGSTEDTPDGTPPVKTKVYVFGSFEDHVFVLRPTVFLHVSDGHGGTKMVTDNTVPAIKCPFINGTFTLTEAFAKDHDEDIETIKGMLTKHPEFGKSINWFKGDLGKDLEPKPGDYRVKRGPR